MTQRFKKMLQIVVVLLSLTVIVNVGYHLMQPSEQPTNATAVNKKVPKKQAVAKKQVVPKKKTVKIDWRKPSETKPYPKLAEHPNAWIRVAIKRQRVYIMDGNKRLYRMYASTGTKGGTPTGTFAIQKERGDFFYNAASGEGARYWVSWKDHGIYLFHTVPTDENGNYNLAEAAKLGKSAASHGCVRLSVPDARWIYENVPEGMRVVIDEK
ncbi:cell surface protein [Loigolactobacillus backii]|uniref:L,D-transpeptidase n=1 Tax=Loigolactobacillus backii TaxID=375175 RepID=UPI0007F16AC6|nr:L,D-transpeptidase [Loigolactobacillus backii]ANK59332.1 cell surface protein [Loigolactobacillus backii]ANK64324.1 cell surface protein [Loigolactobacillus backii]ANK67281.1 cell surface protein [Loigolactobacillus backii]OLF69790.1 hypothetical protein ACX53_06135 [Loigolactobacillus backii]PIO88006.1 hypothetical protein B8A32_02620 [Loigolactobacillus backii]